MVPLLKQKIWKYPLLCNNLKLIQPITKVKHGVANLFQVPQITDIQILLVYHLNAATFTGLNDLHNQGTIIHIIQSVHHYILHKISGYNTQTINQFGVINLSDQMFRCND